MRVLLLIFFIHLLLNSSGQRTPCDPDGNKPYSQFPQDTTIILPSGTMITFNRCEFFDVRNCLEIIEIRDTADLRREGLNMYDRDGNILITCGMLKIDMKNCNKNCFEIPLKIKLKVRFQNCFAAEGSFPGLYVNNGSGWEKPQNNNSSLSTINKEFYLEFTTACPIFINCDIPKRGRKTKFVAPKGYKIQQLDMGIQCPLFVTEEKLSRPKRRTKIRLLCTDPDRIILRSTLIDRSGNKMTTQPKSFSQLRHGRRRMNCKEPKKNFFNLFFGWVSPQKGNFRHKYFIPSTWR